MDRRCRAVAVVALMLCGAAASPAIAQSDDQSQSNTSPSDWGVTIWGVSYHLDKSLEYNGQNWGLGVRRYGRPDWGWLGSSDETRLFVEVDALKNSWQGVVLPVSGGIDYKIASLSDTCSIFAVATFTVAYYQNAIKGVSDVRYGPVPAISIGCGHVRSNAVMVFSQRSGLAVIAGSWTIVF